MSVESSSSNYHCLEVLSALTASASFFCIGAVRSISSPVTHSMRTDDSFNSNLSEEQLAWIASVPPLGSFVGAVISGPILQLIGRQRTLLFLSIPSAVGWGLIGLAPNPAVAIAGRALTGVAAGLSVSTAQLYISEISRPKIRGLLSFLPAIMMALGILIGFILGSELSWRTACLSMVIFPVLTFVLTLFIPKSPAWLLLKKRENKALKSLQKLRGETNKHFQPDDNIPENRIHHAIDGSKVHLELAEMKQNQRGNPNPRINVDQNKNSESPEESTKPVKWSLQQCKDLCWPTMLTISLQIFQQLSGINAIVYYLQNILEDADFEQNGHRLNHIYKLNDRTNSTPLKNEEKFLPAENSSLSSSMIIVGSVQLLAVFISLPLIDRVGRKYLLYASGFLMTLAHLALGAYFFCYDYRAEIGQNLADFLQYNNNGPDNEGLNWVLLGSLCLFMAAYSLGWACIPFLIASEVFPPHLRSYGSSLSSLTNLLAMFGVVRYFLRVKESLVPGGIYFVAAGSCLISIFVVYLTCPETKGKSLSQVNSLFQSRGRPENLPDERKNNKTEENETKAI